MDRLPLKKDMALCALLAAFCLFLFRDIIIGGHLLMGSDFVAGYLSLKQHLYNEIHIHHSIPFWNPYLFGGMPFWAHFESTIFYPLDFLFWIMPPEKAYGYTMSIHLALAGIFTYILARSLDISPPGSFLAGAVFIGNGFVMATTYDGQMFRVQAYTWLPLIIYLLKRALKSKNSYFYSALAGLFWGVQILAGAPQDALYTFFAALLFLGCYANYEIKKIRHGLKILTIPAILFAIGVGVSAIQTVAAFEFIIRSVRAVLDRYDLVTIGSYPPEGIVTLVMPHFFGSFIKGNFWVSDVPWSVPLYNLYVGILPLMLLFYLSYRRQASKRMIIFIFGLAIIAFLMALGANTPLYKLVYLLPGFDRIRAPSKILVLWVFALSLMAGKGLEDLSKQSRASLMFRSGLGVSFVVLLLSLDILFQVDGSQVLGFFSPFIPHEAIPSKMSEATSIISGEFHRLTLFSILTVLIILLWIRTSLKWDLAAALLCGVLLTDLVYVNGGAVRHNDEIYRWAVQTKKELDNSLGKDRGLYRVGSYKNGMGANIEMYLGYQSVGGYTPLFLYRYYQYINKYSNGLFPESWVSFSYGQTENTKLMDLLNVKYEISHETKSYSLRKTYFPRAFVVPEYETVKKEEILDHLLRPDFDPKQVVLFEEHDFQPELPQHTYSGLRTEARINFISYRPDQMVLKTDSEGSGFLFLSEIFYPGWKAYLDDKPTRILRGNYLFRVIELPKGQHEVRLVFDPMSIKIGIVTTLFTLFVLLNILIYRFHKRIPFLRQG